MAMTPEQLGELLDHDDIPAAVRQLRWSVDEIPPVDLARIVGRIAASVPFEDLVTAAHAFAQEPHSAQAAYDLGYACIERGLSFVAIPVLRGLLGWTSNVELVLTELVSAYEDEHRHAEALAVLEDHDGSLSPWPSRYLAVYNAVFAGDLDRAHRHLARLPEPTEDRWGWAWDRIHRIVGRADALRPLDGRDLRGWHFVLTGGILTTLSPYGFDQGLTSSPP